MGGAEKGKLGGTPTESKGPMRDVSWRPWNGIQEGLASVSGSSVIIWLQGREDGVWSPAQKIDVGLDVWHASWMEMANVLLLSCGLEEQQAIVVKQRLDGKWE